MTSEIFEERYKALNKKQKEAVDTIYGPVMVVAGPGTGKTTVLTLRIANILLKTDAKPEEILALTFTENGARAMREKLRGLIGDTAFRVNIFTFHAFANYIRGLYPENFKKIGERQPASDADKIEIIEDLLGRGSFKELRVSKFGISISKISGRISDLKRELVDPKRLTKIIKKHEGDQDGKEKHIARITEFAELYGKYERELEVRALYDFDDAIIELIDALRSHDDMRSEVRESFQFILADEHQDANGAQNEILHLFKNDNEVDPPNIFVVGDDKQSIFRFQGASLEHFYNFADEFKGAKRIVLEDNYRSQRVILEGSHSLISRDGRVHQELRSNVSHEEKSIEIVEYPDYEHELSETARSVARLIGEHEGRDTVAVIARHNKTLFDLAPYLEAEGVDFRIAGERSLFDDLEYRRLFTLLEALSDPYEGRLAKALYVGYFGVSVPEVLRISGEARKERRDAAEIILGRELGPKIKPLITKAKKMLVTEFLKELKDELYSRATSEAYDSLRAVFEEARKLMIKNRVATLDDLVAHLRFLERHDLAPLSGEKRTEAPVELLSVHRSKGLEYDYVFIIDVVASKFEGSGKRGDLLAIPGIGTDSELEEERRLLYVAMTRGRKHVTLSYSLIDPRGSDTAPSALLGEIDQKSISRVTSGASDTTHDLLAVPRRDESINKDSLHQAFLLRSFSVTALNSFLKCPWRYFFRNLLLIPDVPEYAASLGNTCHNVLKEFHLMARKGEIMSRDDLRDTIRTCAMREPFTSSELLLAMDKSEEYLSAYVGSFKPFSKEEQVAIEESFSFVYEVKDGKRTFEVPITGKIDLARESGGVMTVIDFKTKKRMTRNAIMGKTKSDSGDEMRQLQFYKFLVERVRPDVEVGSGTLTFLNPEEGAVRSETFALSRDDVKTIEDTLRDTLIKIYDLDFLYKTCEDKDCEYCKLSRLYMSA